MAAAVKAAKSIQEARQEAEEKIRGAEYSIVCIKEGAICKKDPVNTSIQVSITITPGPVATYKPLNSSI